MVQIKMPKENILDRAIRYVAPIKAARRFRARATLSAASAYIGASKSRRSMLAWKKKEMDADSALLPELPTLRERSEDLLRGSPIAVGAVNTTLTNVIGTGLKLQARLDRDVVKMSDDQAAEWETITEREWRLYSESRDCHSARVLNFTGLQNLCFRKVLEDGDIFVLTPRIKRRSTPYSLALQLVEGARVCNKDNQRDTETLSAGIERDENGAAKTYHILDQHPGAVLLGKSRTWKEVPAYGEKTGMRNVFHLFEPTRPGQSRGAPFLTPVIETIKQIDKYTESEVMAAVLSSMFTIFIKTESQMDLAPMVGDQEVNAAKSSSDEDIKMGVGAIIGLRPGESIETADPTRPNTQFDPFVQSILQQTGAALGIPYEILILHFSASFSASRGALLEAWKFFKVRRKWVYENLCQPVYETWMPEAVALGRISAPGFFSDPLLRKAYCGALWIGDAPSQINPVLEVDAAIKRMDACLSTADEETTNLTGGDFDTNLPRIIKERKRLRDEGLWLPPWERKIGGAAI